MTTVDSRVRETAHLGVEVFLSKRNITIKKKERQFQISDSALYAVKIRAFP